MGFRVTGIDRSEQSLNTARQHAQSMGLSVQYFLMGNPASYRLSFFFLEKPDLSLHGK